MRGVRVGSGGIAIYHDFRNVTLLLVVDRKDDDGDSERGMIRYQCSLSQGGGGGPQPADDPGGCDSILPRPGDPAGREALHQLHRHLVRWLHLWRASWTQDSVPGTCS